VPVAGTSSAGWLSLATSNSDAVVPLSFSGGRMSCSGSSAELPPLVVTAQGKTCCNSCAMKPDVLVCDGSVMKSKSRTGSRIKTSSPSDLSSMLSFTRRSEVVLYETVLAPFCEIDPMPVFSSGNCRMGSNRSAERVSSRAIRQPRLSDAGAFSSRPH
jgi:hypothetical protein